MPFDGLSWSALLTALVDAGAQFSELLGAFFVLFVARVFLTLLIESMQKRG